MLRRWLGLAALVIVLDQISKYWISSHFIYLESMTVNSVFATPGMCAAILAE